MKEKQKKQIKVNIPKEIGEGIYSNIVFMNFNASEFIVDFGRLLPAIPEAKIYSRIVMNPQHCKRLMHLLERNIEKFENQFGEISLPEVSSKKDIGFDTKSI
ncbi:MAG: DUF3467 domain-containing protein [Candidatus Cloacimonetes bacterium]|nr:DUF3467 domain-containing protein [Candidatus Cloacimonadota bacterium]MBL7086222.1 DUF3467 domain-containing protein [Candidatus Cloacimonadota bacterium]